jgi:hypothetical protein
MPQPIGDAALASAYSYAWTMPGPPPGIRPEGPLPAKREQTDPARQFRDWLREFQDERTGGVSPPPMA